MELFSLGRLSDVSWSGDVVSNERILLLSKSILNSLFSSTGSNYFYYMMSLKDMSRGVIEEMYASNDKDECFLIVNFGRIKRVNE